MVVLVLTGLVVGNRPVPAALVVAAAVADLIAGRRPTQTATPCVTLARLRNARGWTFDELADRSGLARRTFIDLEHGRAVGTVTTWHAIAHAFDVPIEYLLGPLCDDHTPPGSKGA